MYKSYLPSSNTPPAQRADGFTIIEISVVIVLILVLTALVAASMPQARVRSRDTDRTADVVALKNYFEQRYTEDASAKYPTYPSTTSLMTDLAPLTSSGLRNSAINPAATDVSVISATTNGDQASAVTTANYVYQPFSPDGSLCTTSSANLPCVRFKLWYKLEENTPSATYLESVHQQ